MRLKLLLAALALLAANLFSTAQAAPITYTLSGTMSGQADFTSFDAAFTWTITGETTQKQALASGGSGVPALTSVLNITGVGSFTPLDPLFAVPEAPAFIISGANLVFEAVTAPDANVPEPITLMLLGAGLAGVGFMRRRRIA